MAVLWLTACGNSGPTATSEQLAVFESRISALEPSNAVAAAALTDSEERVKELELRLAVLEAVAEDNSTRLDDLVARLALARAGLTNLQADLSIVELAALEDLLSYVSCDLAGQAVVVSGANLHVRNGTGRTDGALNGLGNLIIGYAEDSEGVDRSGSHNLVGGIDNSWQDIGGLVAGEGNAVTGMFSSVTAGRDNLASGPRSSVSGGSANEALDADCSVSGGTENLASEWWGSAAGGQNNRASGGGSHVVGGQDNETSGDYGSVTGGYDNLASGTYSSVTGGTLNEAKAGRSSVYGGSGNVVTEDHGYAP